MSFLNSVFSSSNRNKNYSSLLLFDKNSERGKKRYLQMLKRKAALNTTDSIKIESTVQSSLFIKENSTITNNISQIKKNVPQCNDIVESPSNIDKSDIEVNISDLERSISEEDNTMKISSLKIHRPKLNSFIKLSNNLIRKKISLDGELNNTPSYMMALNEDNEKKKLKIDIDEVITEEKETPRKQLNFDRYKKFKFKSALTHNKNAKSELSFSYKTFSNHHQNRLKSILDECTLLRKKNKEKLRTSQGSHSRNNTALASPIKMNDQEVKKSKTHRKTLTLLISDCKST